MKLLVATKEGQGGRTTDFSFTKEGELVRFGFPCDRDRDDVDGSCGCRRSWSGLETSKATTTARVAEVPMTTDVFEKVLRISLERSGWLPGLEEDEPGAVRTIVEDLVRIADGFRVNDVVELRGDLVKYRGKAFQGKEASE